MSFHRNRYLEWYLPRMMRDDAINLHASGVKSLLPADLELPDYDPWQVREQYEERLASWLSLPADSLMFTPGATGGTLIALLTLTSPRAELLVESPMYEPLVAQAERVGTVRRFTRDRRAGWALPLEQIEGLLTPRTELVMVTEPSNPSGTCASREDLLQLADMSATRGAKLLVNETYLGFSDQPSMYGARDNIMVVSSFSKLMGAYWLRLGWLAGAAADIARLRWGHFNFGMSTMPAAAYGLALLRRADELRGCAQDLAAAGAATVADWIASRPELSWTPPQGPGFGCVVLPEGVGDDVAFAGRLHEEQGVLVVPGSLFEVPGTLRLSWLQAGDRLEEGLERLERALGSPRAS